MKPGAGQGSPLRVAPPVQKILRRTLFLVWGSGVVRLERRILDIVDTSPSEMMLASLEPETLLAWCCAFFGMALGGSGVELHRPGCDRCWPCCISSSACSEDRVSGVLRARRACGVRFWRWRRRQGRGGVRVDSVRDGVLLVPRGAGHFGCAQRGVPTVQTVQKAVLASTSL